MTEEDPSRARQHLQAANREGSSPGLLVEYDMEAFLS